MNRPDGYYGQVAESYEPSRSVKPKWKAEHAAVERFVMEGPVLDVPFGTGRFVPIYRAKELAFTGIDISADMLAIARQKFPDANPKMGSIFDLACDDGSFATVVCVRFLEWLPLDHARPVLDRLRRIADTLIVTMTHGVEGQPEAYTYDFGKFLRALDGLRIEDRRVTASVRGMTSEVLKLRPARWDDVLSQLRFHQPVGRPADHLQRIVDKHCEICGVQSTAVSKETMSVRAEYWESERIGQVLRDLWQRSARFMPDKNVPRRMDKPITLLEHAGVTLIVDGLRRASRWMAMPGPHPVLVIRPHG